MWAEGTSLSLDPSDPGNYRPDGTLAGTRYGISARSYPDIDIRNLTYDEACTLRKRDYWNKVRGDEVSDAVAFVLAEAAYGSGPVTAIRQMQQIVGTANDGIFGPATMEALQAALAKKDGTEDFLWEYSAQRLLYEASLATWPTYRVGWSRRMFHAMWHATMLAGVPLPPQAPSSDELLATLLARLTAAGKALAG